MQYLHFLVKSRGYGCADPYRKISRYSATINFSGKFIGLIVLVPLDVAIGTVIETGINKCNELGNFVFEHYYVTNGKIPELSEIDGIIKIVME